MTVHAVPSSFPVMSAVAAPAGSPETFICVAGEIFRPISAGALWWETQRTLIVSDLHLEKGSNFARRGQLLPPHDTGATLSIVEQLASRLRPSIVISLGDSFHDPEAEARLHESDRERIRALTSATVWFWVEGNHDPVPPAHLGGRGTSALRLGPCVFRHEPSGETGEIAGHLHPVARVGGRGRSVRRKCFVSDGSRLIMPSLGAFTGGLNVLHPAIAGLFDGRPMIFAASSDTVHLVDRRLLRPERPPAAENRVWKL